MAFGRLIEVSIGPAGSLGTQITEQRISFVVDKVQSDTPNKCTLDIYNLSDDTITKVAKVGNKVILRAGYEDEGGVKSLFFGDTTRAIRVKDQTEKILKIEAFDGQTNLTETNVSLSYFPGISADVVTQDIISLIGLPLGNIITPTGSVYRHGFSFVGKAKDALNSVLFRVGRFFSVQNEQIIILELGEISRSTGLKITPNSGLINEPKLLDDLKSGQSADDVPKRYEVDTLLLPQLVPGANVIIESSQVNGTFKIEDATFKGDNFEGEFVTTIEVVAV